MPYQRKRTLQELNLSDDFLFSKVFSDAEVCRQVLEKILKVKIKRIKFVESQKTIDLVMESKAIRLDIYVQDEAILMRVTYLNEAGIIKGIWI